MDKHVEKENDDSSLISCPSIIWLSSMGTTAIGQFVTPCAAIGCFTWTIVFLTKFFDPLTGSGHFGLGNGKYNSEKVWKLETLRK